MPRTQSPATIVKHLRAVLKRAEDWDCTSVAEDNAIRATITILEWIGNPEFKMVDDDIRKSFQALKLVGNIARMTTEEEMAGGGASEDHIATLNGLIENARKITGINPQHPVVYCISCGDLENCTCEGKGMREH
jgi:hypothetical protein